MRVVCKYCNKKFASDAKLAFHNTYFCGPNARMTAGQAKMGRKNHGSRNTGGSSKKEQKKSAKKGKKKKGESSSESEWEPSDEDDDEEDDDEDDWDDDGGAFEVSAAAAKTKGKDKCHPCSNTLPGTTRMYRPSSRWCRPQGRFPAYNLRPCRA